MIEHATWLIALAVLLAAALAAAVIGVLLAPREPGTTSLAPSGGNADGGRRGCTAAPPSARGLADRVTMAAFATVAAAALIAIAARLIGVPL